MLSFMLQVESLDKAGYSLTKGVMAREIGRDIAVA
jgi:hypothetical protein